LGEQNGREILVAAGREAPIYEQLLLSLIPLANAIINDQERLQALLVPRVDELVEVLDFVRPEAWHREEGLRPGDAVCVCGRLMQLHKVLNYRLLQAGGRGTPN